MNNSFKLMMNAGSICNREVITVDVGVSLVEAALMMREKHVGSLVVVKRTNGSAVPVGIITDRDLVVQIMAFEIPYDQIKVNEIMNKELFTVNQDLDIWAVIKQMRSHGVRRLPVVDGLNGLVGIVSIDDIICLLSSELNDLSDIIQFEQYNEQAKRVILQ